MLARLNELDKERKAITAAIKGAVAHVMEGEAPFPLGAKKRKKAAGGGNDPVGIVRPKPLAAPKKRTMSAEAREKIAAAQRKRWAKQKRAAKD